MLRNSFPNRLIRGGVPVIALMGIGFLATGCGEAVNDRVVNALDCGSQPDNTLDVEYRNLKPGDKIKLGHPTSYDGGVDSDVEVTINESGQVQATSTNRSDLVSTGKPAVSSIGEGVEVVISDESYVVKAHAQSSDRFAIEIAGHCVS
jgi:hypothetical protein